MIDWIDRYPPNLTIEMLIAMCIAGGWGWVIGVTPAWMIGRERPAPSNVGRVLALMFVLAVWFVSFGLTSIQVAQHGSFGPMIDGIGARDPLRDRLAVSIAADTALVVTTLVVLAGYTIVRSERRVVPKRPPPDHVENA